MIRINLLGKKKIGGQVPFGLDDKLAKLGINLTVVNELRPALVRLVFLWAGLYLADFVPVYLHDERVKELDAQMAKLSVRTDELQKELATKRDIRKQMEQLNREEVELQRQLNAVSALQRDRGQAFRTLDSLITSLPAKVWVEDLNFEKNKVSLNGKSWEYFPINDFVKIITESTNYFGVQFKDIRSEGVKKLVPGVPEVVQKQKAFSLDFNVKGSGE